MENKYKDLSLVLATIAGFFMVASAMFFSVTTMGVTNNNAIGIEIAETSLIYNISLQTYPGLNDMIIINNKIAKGYSALAIICFAGSLILGLIAALLVFPKKS